MSEIALFQCRIENSDPSKSLDFEILLDNKRVFYSGHISDPVDFEQALSNDEAEHILEFVMTSKTPDHTVIDDAGNIVEDAMISLKNLSMDGIDIFQLFTEKSVYRHSFNGAQPEFDDQFFGDMGCNGKIIFKFSTPFYSWMLENT